MEWKHININNNMIEFETAKSVKIKLPNNSKYKNYVLWYPKKLVRDDKYTNTKRLSYTDDFTFKIVKYGQSRSTCRNIISEIELDVDEFESVYETVNQVLSSNRFEKHIPEHLEPEKIEVLDELKDI